MEKMESSGSLGPTGKIELARTRDLGMLGGVPVRQWRIKNWLQHGRRSTAGLLATKMLGKVSGVMTVQPRLSGVLYRADWAALAPWQREKLRELLRNNFDAMQIPRHFGGHALDLGVLSSRVVTTAGVNYIVDAFQNTTELENLKYHGYGTGTNAEAVGDTALQTELTTQYVSDNTRPTGTTAEGASANIFQTVATLSPDSGGTIAITEHGIFSQAATGGGTLLDRSVFSAVNVVASSDSLQTTYELTVSSGG